MSKKWKSLRVEEQTHSNFKFVADRMSIDISALLEDLGKYLLDIFGEFKLKSANCFYDVRGNQLIITAFGKSYLVSGSFPAKTLLSEKDADRLISEKVGKQFKEIEEQ